MRLPSRQSFLDRIRSECAEACEEYSFLGIDKNIHITVFDDTEDDPDEIDEAEYSDPYHPNANGHGCYMDRVPDYGKLNWRSRKTPRPTLEQLDADWSASGRDIGDAV